MKFWIVLALAAMAGAAGAQAQLFQIPFLSEPAPPDPVPPPPGYDFDDGYGAPPARPARACRKMCANDLSPCDPIYFKTEDGRCDGLDETR